MEYIFTLFIILYSCKIEGNRDFEESMKESMKEITDAGKYRLEIFNHIFCKEKGYETFKGLSKNGKIYVK